jgi:hypothetical protein
MGWAADAHLAGKLALARQQVSRLEAMVDDVSLDDGLDFLLQTPAWNRIG